MWYDKNNKHFEGSDLGLVCLREKEVVHILASVFMPAYLKSEPCNYC